MPRQDRRVNARGPELVPIFWRRGMANATSRVALTTIDQPEGLGQRASAQLWAVLPTIFAASATDRISARLSLSILT